MKLAVPAFGQTLGTRPAADTPPRFGVPHLLTVVLMVVALPVFAIGAVVALPVGAAVFGLDAYRRTRRALPDR